jgi:hypothetical protein
MRNFTIKGIKNSLALKLDRTSFNDTAVAQFGGADGLLIKDDVWAIIAQLPLKSLTIDQSIQLPNVQEQYYTSVNSIYPPIYEVPQAILQMKTLENLTINRNDNVLFPDISGLPKLKILKIGSSYEDTSIYLLKKNVDIFMTRSTMNKDLNFLTIKGPIHGIKIFGLKNRDDFYALASFKQRYGHNTFGIFQIVGFE